MPVVVFKRLMYLFDVKKTCRIFYFSLLPSMYIVWLLIQLLQHFHNNWATSCDKIVCSRLQITSIKINNNYLNDPLLHLFLKNYPSSQSQQRTLLSASPTLWLRARRQCRKGSIGLYLTIMSSSIVWTFAISTITRLRDYPLIIIIKPQNLLVTLFVPALLRIVLV